MKKDAALPATTEAFAEFLHGVTLDSIMIENCSATIRDPKVRERKRPSKLAIAFANDAKLLVAGPDQCEVVVFYGVRVLPTPDADSEKEWMAEFDVEYRLQYGTPSPMTEEFFEQFKALTLKLNTIPFAREWIHSTSAKMGLKPILLPLAVSVVKKPKTRRVRKEE